MCAKFCHCQPKAIHLQKEVMIPLHVLPTVLANANIIVFDASVWQRLCQEASVTAVTVNAQRQRPTQIVSDSVVRVGDIDHGLSDPDSCQDSQSCAVSSDCVKCSSSNSSSCTSCEQAKKQMRMKTQQLRRANSKIKALEKQRETYLASTASDLNITKHKGLRKLTPEGVIAVGVRMFIASCRSAMTFIRATLTEISCQTVWRCEVVTAAAIIAVARLFGTVMECFLSGKALLAHDKVKSNNFFGFVAKRKVKHLQLQCDESQSFAESQPDMCEEAADGSDDVENGAILHALLMAEFNIPPKLSHEIIYGKPVSGLSFLLAGYAFQTDATNSKLFRKKKVAGLFCEASILVDAEHLASDDFEKAFASHSVMSLSGKQQ